MTRFFGIFLLALVAFAGCSNSSEPAQSRRELIIGIWGVTEVSPANAPNAADVGTIMHFGTDNYVKITPPGDDSETVQLKYSFGNNDQKLTIGEGATAGTADILELSSSRMRLQIKQGNEVHTETLGKGQIKTGGVQFQE